MKDILIDIYKTKNIYTGLGQFSMNFAKEIETQHPKELAIDFFVPKNTHLTFSGKNINIVQPSFLKRYFPASNKNYFIWHSLQQFPSFFPRKNTIWILTIHDLNFMIEKDESKKKKYLNQLQKNVDQADYITTISYFTKKEIEKHIDIGKKEIHVIYNGVVSVNESKITKPTFVQKEKFFFSIGVFNEKKNFKVLLPLIKHFDNYQLIIAGSNDTKYGKEIKSEIEKLGLKDKVILPGTIDDSDKYWLYANCDALLFPSLAEGFGLPVIEAMYAGKPVFLSSHTSLPEIGGPLAFYFDNFNIEDMTDLIRSKLKYVNNNLENFENESKIYASKFNWRYCMSNYLKLYDKIKTTHNNGS